MSHTFNLIRNAMAGCVRPVSTNAKRQGGQRQLLLAAVIASITGSAVAGPEGGVVVDGNALIHYQDALTLINQKTDAITINWQDFDINAGETVTFLQPDANSLALNRVLSGDGTQINGQLNANGRVFVLDANGVLFGESAQVNVGSLVASSLELNSADYANGHFTFTGNGKAGKVTNLGTITVADTGSVALLGGQVSNQGVIRARLGHIALAAGNKMTLDFAGDGLLNVQVDEGTAQALVNNGGLIQADGGSVLMTAHASDALLQTVVNNTGVIEARTLQEQEGKIMLLGGFNGGTVRVAGTLDASAPNAGNGGFIETSGAIVKTSGSAIITAASEEGDAGSWLLDPTNLEISYRADGVDDNVSHAHNQTLQNTLNTGTEVKLATTDSGSAAGNITLLDPLVWSGTGSLTLIAHNNIRFNDYIHAPSGSLVLSAGGTITSGHEGHINIGSFVLEDGTFSQINSKLPEFIARDFTLNGGSFMRAAGGRGSAASPWQLTDIYGLQGFSTHLAGHAVLINGIDATSTRDWNGKKGFSPIGFSLNNDPNNYLEFTGSFDGKGFVIDGLTIDRPDNFDVGLFGTTNGASLSNIALENIDISGGYLVGGIAGSLGNDSTLSHSYATGSVKGLSIVGGLIGDNWLNSIISQSYANVNVTALEQGTLASFVGGLVGTNDRSDIQNSYATGTVTSNNDGAGGLVGLNQGRISSSYATGEVTGVGHKVGGLVGENRDQKQNVDINASYWDSVTTGQVDGVGTGLATGVMEVIGDWTNPSVAGFAYNQNSYTDFDFTNTWFIADGSSRPMLRAFLSADGSIANLYQLQGIVTDLNGDYFLTQDIDASATTSTNMSDVWGGRGFAPIGDKVNGAGGFTGSLDGKGFTIDGLTINRLGNNYVGLFSTVEEDGRLFRLALNDASIKGNSFVGGLVGSSAGEITQSYVSGDIVGAGNEVGGLVGKNLGNVGQSHTTGSVIGSGVVGGLIGFNNLPTLISDSYSTATVKGSEQLGGLIGRMEAGTVSNSYAAGGIHCIDSCSGFIGGLVGTLTGSTVINSYSTTGLSGTVAVGGLVGMMIASSTVSNSYASGFVNGTGNVGGLVGMILNSNILSSYWDVLTTDQSAGVGTSSGSGHIDIHAVDGDWDNSPNAYNKSSYADLDFTDTWYLAEGNSRPMLRAFLNYTQDGAGRYEISNITQLQGMAADLAGKYILVGDIDASSTASQGDISDVWRGRGFAPIGHDTEAFTGSLNGAGFTITDLTIDGHGKDNIGLFGVTEGAQLTNITLQDAIIVGQGSIGGLVGKAGLGTYINQSYFHGEVYGEADNIGGIVGDNRGTIHQSYAEGDVRAEGFVGGLAGYNAGTITQSYAASNIFANGLAGGLVGINDGNINQSYSTGIITGDGHSSGVSNVGGLVGWNTGNIKTSFWNSANGVGVGDNWGQIDTISAGLSLTDFTDPERFAAWGNTINADGSGNAVWRIYEGQTAPLLRHFLTDINVTAYDETVTYDGTAYEGRHHINGTTGNGVRYGKNYAEFLAVFGTDGTPYQASGDALGSQDLTYTGSSQGAVNAGDYGLTADSLWSTQTGYNIVTPTGKLTIESQQITIDLTIDDATKIYGNLDPSFTWHISNGKLGAGDTLSGILSREAGENVGSYAITGKVTGDLASPNYDVTINNGVFTITPRPISIGINDLEKIYGDLDPSLVWKITSGSLAPQDAGDLDSLVSLIRAAGENVGSYDITGELHGALTSGNYQVSIDNGKLTITPRAIELTADTLAKIYGQADPTLGWEITGGSVVEGDTLIVEVSRDQGRDVGHYTIHLNVSGDVASSGNYVVSKVDGKLDITPATLTVTANDIRTYWDRLPPYSARIDGLVEGDTLSDVFGNSLVVLSDLKLPNPGDYTLTPTGQLQSGNYLANFVNGTLSLLSSHPGGNYDLALTGSQLPAREALGREQRANIFEARPLLDGSESGISLQLLDGGVRLDENRLAALGLRFPEAVRFPVNSAVIAEQDLADLRHFATQLQRYPQVQILVAGHTSSTGSLALNDRLSKARAAAVTNALQTMGLAQSRIRTEAYNYQYPVASNDTEVGRALNQRTEITEDKN